MTAQVQLKRSLRKSILQGTPWIYRDAVQIIKASDVSTICKLKDKDGSHLGWGFYDPHGPLAVRVLCLDKKPPNDFFYEQRLRQALQSRQGLITKDTNAYRLINGEGDFLPGFICDIYDQTAVMQFDGLGPHEFWSQDFLADWLLQSLPCSRVYFKPRHDSNVSPKIWGEPWQDDHTLIKENTCQFLVDIVNGQKTGFFFDQRDNRNHVSQYAKNKSVLNLFSYSGGFSIYAGLGGAQRVSSVDIAKRATELCSRNWQLNELEAPHEAICADVFEYLKSASEKFDMVICDPPSMAKAEKHKSSAIEKYTETFASSASKVIDGGDLVLSSCSSHISFNDFEEIIAASLSKARLKGQVLRVSGQGADHPYPRACEHLRYLKFYHLKVYK